MHLDDRIQTLYPMQLATGTCKPVHACTVIYLISKVSNDVTMVGNCSHMQWCQAFIIPQVYMLGEARNELLHCPE